MNEKVYKIDRSFVLESGAPLPSMEIAYHTWGKLNEEKDNVVWICHALTASADAADWWHILVGKGKVFDPDKYFIVCPNILGSCYGSSGPLSVNTETGKPYYTEFPKITIRDIVKAHIELKNHLGIDKIRIGAGGSMGAYQLQEWALTEPDVIQNLIMLCTSARESAWGIAIHTAQRLAIEADTTWKQPSKNAGAAGLKAARAIGMLTYRNYETFVQQQTDSDLNKSDGFKASSYILHQGDKLVNRFNAYSYWLLSKAMDSHNLVRSGIKGRPARLEDALRMIKAKTLVIGISSDILCPLAEQRFLAAHIPGAKLKVIDSGYGHDGFLIEEDSISAAIGGFLKSN